MYCSVGVLEYILANPLKVAFKKLDLLTNFVKNELLHRWFLPIIRLLLNAHTCRNTTATLSLCYAYSHWWNVFPPFLSLNSQVHKQDELFLQKSHLSFYFNYSKIFIFSGAFEKEIWYHIELLCSCGTKLLRW